MAKKQAPRTARRKPNITSITYWRKFATHRVIYFGLAAVIGLGIVMYFGSSPWGGGSGTARREYLADAIAIVNGEPVSRGEYEKMAEGARRRSGGSIAMVVMQEGYILSNLVDSALLRAEAHRRGLWVSDAEVDKAITEMRTIKQANRTERLSDDDLLKISGMETMSDLREGVTKDLLPQMLGEALSRASRLTFDDLARSHDEVKVRHILISVSGAGARPGKGLPEGQAKRKAEQILQEARSGGPFGALADKYTDDPGNKPPRGPAKGGDLGWYKRGGGFAKEFEDAAFSLRAGEVSGLVKTPFGFHIIKVDEIRRNLPKDYEKTKVQQLEALRSRRVSESLRTFMEGARPKAKIAWHDPSLEWRFAYSLGGPMGSIGMFQPNAAEGQEAIRKKLRAYVPTHKTDSAAALILGQMLYRDLMTAGLPPGIAPAPQKPVNRNKLRAEVIQCYEIALEHAEDQGTRVALATLYREAKQDQKALDQYRMMHRLMAWDEGVESRTVREQVEKGLRELGDVKLADEEAKKIAVIRAKEEQQQKEAAEKAKAEKAEQDKKRAEAAPPKANAPSTSATSGTITIPAPTSGGTSGR